MTHTTNSVATLSSKVELLAPAGRWESLEAVIDAGADAVYLGSKHFNMRRHRGDFHFDAEQMVRAVEFVHNRRRRIYVTVNALVGQVELDDLRDLLCELERLGVDAVIVSDLATLKLARQIGMTRPLHASTMMNVHHASHAIALKQLGVTRVITSRDIPLDVIGAIGREAEIEVECFVHGDMCVAQSGQCGMSGVLFGKSANRGECMKPCRWEYELVNLDTEEIVGAVGSGHLLALKDLCMIRHIPDIIQAGITCMKIEGRMRDAAYLAALVGSYREAIDRYYECPPAFQLAAQQIESVYTNKVRSLSTLTMLGGASHRGVIDVSGNHEPLLLSNGIEETEIDAPQQDVDSELAAEAAAKMELAVCVSNLAGARAAIRGGATRLYVAAELSQFGQQAWSLDDVVNLIGESHDRGVTVGIRTPHVTTAREWAETEWILGQLASQELDHVLVHHPGTLALARQRCPSAGIVADFGFNVLNGGAVEMLAELGATEACISNEAGIEEIQRLAERSPLPLEVMAHGQVLCMLVDHCVIALHGSSSGRKDVCRGPCRHVRFGLRDKAGQVRPIVPDQHCRNHLMSGRDVAAMEMLPSLCAAPVRCLRIELPYDPPETIGHVTAVYRRSIDEIARGRLHDGDEALESLRTASLRAFSLGALARSIVHSRSTAAVMKQSRTPQEITV